ncbi:MAG: NUDIX domain-containing protein [Methanobacterium sp.]
MYKTPSLTVDAVIMWEDELIVLIKRKKDPYKNSWALPGGFVEYGEKVEFAVLREVKEETGLEIDLCGIVGVYSDPERDPRGHTVTICYLAKVKGGILYASTDASQVCCFSKKDILNLSLAFDHDLIIKDAFKLIKEKEL